VSANSRWCSRRKTRIAVEIGPVRRSWRDLTINRPDGQHSIVAMHDHLDAPLRGFTLPAVRRAGIELASRSRIMAYGGCSLLGGER
jgi:hypothetical protein